MTLRDVTPYIILGLVVFIGVEIYVTRLLKASVFHHLMLYRHAHRINKLVRMSGMAGIRDPEFLEQFVRQSNLTEIFDELFQDAEIMSVPLTVIPDVINFHTGEQDTFCWSLSESPEGVKLHTPHAVVVVEKGLVYKTTSKNRS